MVSIVIFSASPIDVGFLRKYVILLQILDKILDFLSLKITKKFMGTCVILMNA